MAEAQDPSNPPATTPVQGKAKTPDKVLIGCKLPHGLYLDLRDNRGEIKARVKLPGVAGFTLPNPDRKFKNPTTEHGHTITPVDRDHWEAWKKAYPDFPALLSGAVYEANKREDAIAIAAEHEHVNVGFNKGNPKEFGVETRKDND